MTQELPSGRLQPRVMQEVTPDKPSGSLRSENTKTAGGGKRTTGFFLASPGAAASTGQSCAEQRRESILRQPQGCRADGSGEAVAPRPRTPSDVGSISGDIPTHCALSAAREEQRG